jgi:hypothetical protein
VLVVQVVALELEELVVITLYFLLSHQLVVAEAAQIAVLVV